MVEKSVWNRDNNTNTFQQRQIMDVNEWISLIALKWSAWVPWMLSKFRW